jgi:DNA-binding MarR family transcriptional regulator
MTLRQVALFGFIADVSVVPSYEVMANGLRTSKPVVTRAFKALSLLGLVVCTRDPADRRKRLFSLTPLGIETRAMMKTLAV